MKKYKCPKCQRSGFPSIYYPTCTNCANKIRYIKHELSRQYYPDMDRKSRPIVGEQTIWSWFKSKII